MVVMVMVVILTTDCTNIFSAENRAALRDLEGLEKLVEFVGNKVCLMDFSKVNTVCPFADMF